MKNISEDIIRSFSGEELRSFRYFLLRNGNHLQEREDLKLLDQIRDNKDSGYGNINAAHQTKKRLKKQLEQFTLLENLRYDDTSGIYGLIETARYLFRKNLYRQGWHYLRKAEQMAGEQEEYLLLDHIYGIQVTYARNIAILLPPDLSVPILLKKQADNHHFAEMDSNANAAYALLIHELRELFSQQLSADIDTITTKILQSYGLDDRIYDNNLKIYCKIVNIICRALREKRDYHALKNYSIGSYELIEQRNGLDKISPDFLTDLLDMICVASLRSMDYVPCEKYMTLYAAQTGKLKAHPGEYSYYDFIPFVDKADICMCTNRLAGARESLLTVQKKYASYTQSVRIYFLLRMNLIAMHFAYGEYETCIKLYHELISMDEKKILAERGFRLEMILFTKLYAVIFYYEDGDPDYALYLLQKIKRNYRLVLKRADCKKEQLFISIMEQMISNPSYLKSRKFATDKDQFVRFRKFIPGDYEYISMNAWLHTRTTGKSYYACFLELVGNNGVFREQAGM